MRASVSPSQAEQRFGDHPGHPAASRGARRPVQQYDAAALHA